MRILIFEDNKDLLESLKQKLATNNTYNVVGSFYNCAKIKEKIEQLHPDLVLMDIGMDGIDGLQGLYIIRQYFPQLKVVMLTSSDKEDDIMDSIYLGCNGYVFKNDLYTELFNAINSAMDNKAVLTPSIAHRIIQVLKKPDPKNKNYSLTDRELQVLKPLSLGFTYQQIADELNVARDTIGTHIKNIYSKLEVHSKAEVVRKILKEKLI